MQQIAADEPQVVREILKAAAAALKEVKALAKVHKEVSGGGVYVGAAGIALVYLRMAQQLERGFKYAHGAYLKKHTVDQCLELAQQFLGEAEKLLGTKRVTFLEGFSGLLAAQALLAHMRGNTADLNSKTQALVDLWRDNIQGVLPDIECELLYGRAGYLYSLCWLQQQCGQEVVPTELLKATGGSGGSSGGGYYAAVRGAVDALAAAAFPSGNLPTKLNDREDARVAWCHGGTGFVLTLLKAAEVFGDGNGRYMAAATAAGNDIWRRGLLKKGVGLCHGISGNGYALLALARATRDPSWLSAAQQFGVYGARHWEELHDVPDRPASLFEGLAGAVSFWLDVVEHSQAVRWPGAEL
eukprot:gene9210-9377_t